MTKTAKRLERIRRNPKHVSFEELRQVLEDYGFMIKPSSGTSHYFFRVEVGDRVWTLTVPFKKPHIKVSYVRKALKAIDEIIALQVDESEENHGSE